MLSRGRANPLSLSSHAGRCHPALPAHAARSPFEPLLAVLDAHRHRLVARRPVRCAREADGLVRFAPRPPLAGPTPPSGRLTRGALARLASSPLPWRGAQTRGAGPVSYTHLTLPTICSV
eukprot:263977-Rhodomonas_salina.13